jgi:hypothetical protein
MTRSVPLTLAVLATAVLALAGRAPAFAADPRYPDWPCRQIKVPELSVAAVWAGPPVDDVGDAWENDPQVKDLVARAAARRTPLEQAETMVTDFLAANAARKQESGKLVFAGLFATLNQERTAVMNGIERFAQRQRDFADKIKSKAREIRELQDAPNHEQAKLDELADAINWDTRIFEDKRKSIGYVCDVPVAIEQRLFALARAIQQALE